MRVKQNFLCYNHVVKYRPRLKTWLRAVAIIFVTAALGYGAYRFYITIQILRLTNEELTATTTTFQNTVAYLKEHIELTEQEKSQLSDALSATQTNLIALEQKTDMLNHTVTLYQKLQSLDPELLQKYSKVYFLNENYVPASLSAIDSQYVSGKNRTLQFQSNAYPFLKKMLDDQAAQGLHLLVASAYRSFGTQAALKSSYVITYGSGANKFSADQGYSEHQLGTTVDFTTASMGDLSSKFDTSPEYTWLTENAYKYGFILSYPKNNKYYIYEPWHWRFVGIDLATNLHLQGKYLYDMDQRDLDGYLLSIFDTPPQN